MKTVFLSVMLIGLLLLGSGQVGAQTSDSYPYIPYGSGVPFGVVPYGTNSYAYAPYDPYYDLHTMHYQLYLPQYPVYQPCCYFAGPVWTPPVVVSPPRVIIAPRIPVFRRR